MSVVVALAAGLAIGLAIGTFGGGGGVLAVPALVYLLGQDGTSATTSSIVIVGIVSACGLLMRARSRSIDWRTGMAIGAVGLPAAWMGTWLNRSVPQPVLMALFAALTLLVATVLLVRAQSTGAGRPGSLTRSETGSPASEPAGGGGVRVLDAPVVPVAAPVRRTPVLRTVLAGCAVGFLTGFLGVGGGFLVVPVLVVLLEMPMLLAIGTSLLVIVLNSAVSLVARIGHLHLDWAVVGPFTAAAILAALGGKLLADRLPARSLNGAFAGLLLLVGAGVGVQSLESVLG